MVPNSEGVGQSNAKRRRQPWIIPVAVVAVLVVVGAGFVVNDTINLHGKPDYSYSHRYRLTVLPTNETEYSLLVPVPVNPIDLRPHPEFLEDVQVDNSTVLLSLEQTAHGWALNITGSGSVLITWGSGLARATMWDNDSDHFYREISMLSDYNRSLPNANVSIHSAGCNVRIVLYHYALDWYKWGGSSWEYWFDVITAGAGWHEVPVNAGGAIFN